VYQGRHPLGDACAETAIRLIGRHLRQAVGHGDDLDAREGMALGATIAGLSFSNVGVALVHAMEYPVGGATNCSHGEGNGLLLPHVMRFNLPARRREFARLAELLDEDVSGLTEQAAAERAVAAVDRLRMDIGVPGRLREFGVREEQLPDFAAKTIAIQRMLRVNPRPVTAAECEAIYRGAL
jgi:alcohol dehydrogenase class IV